MIQNETVSLPNARPVKQGTRTRMSFGRIDEVMPMPNLIEVQKNSYNWFLEKGLPQVLHDVGEIVDYGDKFSLSFTGYTLERDKIKWSIKECKERSATYAAPMRVQVRLVNKETGEIKESEIYMGDFPLMTDAGTFIYNGAERVIISQLIRSPGAYFIDAEDKTGKLLINGQLNPNRGAWIEYEVDNTDVISVRIDKTRKLPVSVFIRALTAFTGEGGEFPELDDNGQPLSLSTDDEILAYFGDDVRMTKTLESDKTDKTSRDTESALLELYRKLRPGEPPTVDNAITHLHNLLFDEHRYEISRVGRYKYNKKLGLPGRLSGCVLSRDVVSPSTGEIIASAGERVNRVRAEEIEQAGVRSVWVKIEKAPLVKKKDSDELEEQPEETKIISNGMVEPYAFLPMFTVDELEALGIDEKVSYNVLASILEENEDDKEALAAALSLNRDRLIPRTVVPDDVIASVSYLCNLRYEIGMMDDIDHLANRRIRSVGELLQNQYRIGFARVDRMVHERMSLQAPDPDKITPQALVNIRPVVAAVKEFFGSSQLSQFMDQTNPLAELTNKRRLSALGPGGLSRERAGFEVRDVHYTHYGRMCPIETPEGPNIGLISSLATYARINKYGFIEAPFRKVDKETGKVLDEVVYMTADTEDEYYVAQANSDLDENNCFVSGKRVTVRYRDDFLEVDPAMVDYMDVSPKMVVSVATAMIPFLENDDGHRALMGSNMQRQAVPLLTTEAPLVGTGMEYRAAVDSGVAVLATNPGVVSKVAADKIIILNDNGTEDTYELIKFMRSNQGTCINQRPVVKMGDRVERDQVIADGPATDHGEISLGRNVLIGFMTWEGYNYEDAVLINEKLVREDKYTSIHIEEYETEARDTKLGEEEITRDIPGAASDAINDLDENGIIRVGAEVKAGDILVGKVTPKGETELSAEERLLRAIFGSNAKEVRDTSLKVPHGEYGIVVKVEVFTRENSDELAPGVNKVVRCYIAQKRKLSVGDKMAGRHGNKGVVSRILPEEDMPFMADGTPLDIVLNPMGVPSRMNIGQVLEVHLGYAARKLGMHVMTPVFDGAHESDIVAAMKAAGLREDGKTILYDGRTGRQFDYPVTVGVMYFLKLLHLVDDKIHARSTGPYSLVTQQPLGGKAQFGGQRFGEMEVWALEAYGAAYTLQEILTVKSDDVLGRDKTYKAIVKGDNIPKPGIPESFKVLVKELQSLALDVKVLDEDGKEFDLRVDYDDEENNPRPEGVAIEAGPVLNDAAIGDGFSEETLSEGEYDEEYDDAGDDEEEVYDDDFDVDDLPEE